MKILQISNYYYPHIGGIEQVARDCTNALSEHEVKVICFNHEKGNGKDEVDGVEIIRPGCIAKVASQSISLSYGKILKRAVESFKPDVIIFHHPNPFVAHFLLKVLKKHSEIKLVVYWHLDITRQKILGKFFNGQTRRLLTRAQKIVATSPNYIEGSKFLSQFSDKCTVIPNCVADNKFEECEKSADVRKKYGNKIICFALGRHVPYKGMEYLVRASSYLDDGYKILIGGEGKLTPELKELAKGDDKIEFLGKLNCDDLSAYLGACDIFCFPSITKNEAFGIALAEGMAAGKPCVTFTIEGSGVNYVSLDGVTGIEVENSNSEKFAEAIKTLGADISLRERYGTAARERAQKLFTNKAFSENINRLIDNL